MAQATNYAQNPVSVISPQFCAPQPLNLSIIKKLMTFSRGNFTVTDPHGNIFFKVRGPFPSYRGRLVLYDAAGNPIVTLRQKVLSAHTRWNVFRGDSTEAGDLIFSTKRSSYFQWKTKLDVFLASNTQEVVCDFKVEATWSEKSCTIYAGESSTVIAQMQKKHGFRTILDTKEESFVSVAPNVDYAFIVALILILDEMHSSNSNHSHNPPSSHSHPSSAAVI